jgi:hypothetical protein
MRYLLVLNGHGSGITEDFFLRDDSSRDSLTIDELAQALEKAETKIDILGLDACFMAMGEVAYQIREHVDILIGAEGLEPAFGWPYRRILAQAKAYREASGTKGQSLPPRDLAEMIVRQYVEHYVDYDIAVGRSADLAAIDLTKMDSLANAVSDLAANLKEADEQADRRDLVTLAHWDAQTYKADQFVDLRDFCVLARKRFKGDSVYGVKAACDKVLRVLDGDAKGKDRCIITSGCTGFAHQHSYGISIYFPWAFVSPDYQELEFAKKTKWGLFLKNHVEKTERPSRFAPRPPVRKAPVPESIDLDIAALDKLELHRLLLRRPDGQETVGVDVKKLRRIDFGKIRQLLDDIPSGDRRRELHRRFLRGIGARRSRYTGVGSKYTGVGSKYTGVGSKYTEGTRLPMDRETSVKNLAVGSGVAFWP